MQSGVDHLKRLNGRLLKSQKQIALSRLPDAKSESRPQNAPDRDSAGRKGVTTCAHRLADSDVLVELPRNHLCHSFRVDFSRRLMLYRIVMPERFSCFYFPCLILLTNVVSFTRDTDVGGHSYSQHCPHCRQFYLIHVQTAPRRQPRMATASLKAL